MTIFEKMSVCIAFIADLFVPLQKLILQAATNFFINLQSCFTAKNYISANT